MVMFTGIDWTKPELIWFLIGLVLLLAEFSAPGLVIFFFGIGAWLVALMCALMDVELNTQLFVFLFSSVFFLIILRKHLKRIFIGRSENDEEEEEPHSELIGKKTRLLGMVAPGEHGKVEINGTSWSVEADEEITAGTLVEVIGQRSITLKVRKLAEREN